MRPEAEIVAMRDQLLRRSLTDEHPDGVVAVLTVLEWACNPIIADTALDETIDVFDPADIDERDVLDGLVDAVHPSNLAAVQGYLAQHREQGLKDIAAAARKIDRLCKAELSNCDRDSVTTVTVRPAMSSDNK